MVVEAIETKPTIEYRCRAIGDVTSPPSIRSDLLVANDLIKGDGSTSSTYPTFVSADTETGTPSHYTFDGVDDYVGNWPTMPAAYTVAAVVDTGDGPELWTCNDSTIKDALTVSGDWEGSLYRLAVFDFVLDSDELDSVEYWWVYKVPWFNAKGIDHRLILEGDATAALYLKEDDPEDDRATTQTWVIDDVAFDFGGAVFPDSDSSLTGATLTSGSDFSAIVLGEHETSDGNSTVISFANGIYFVIRISSSVTYLNFSGSELTVTAGSFYGVSCEQDEKPKFYVDGQYVGEGDLNIWADLSDLGAPTVGNMEWP